MQFVLLFCVAVSPLPFGSAEPAIIAGWTAWLSGGLALACLLPGFFPRRGGVLMVMAAMTGLTAAYGIVLHEQLSSTPWFMPDADAVWAETGRLLGVPLNAATIPIRQQPLLALGRPIAYLLALVLGLIVGGIKGGARRLVRVFAWSGLVYAIYAIAAHVFWPGTLLWETKEAYLPYLTGTFINRNTAATYFGCVAAVHLVLLTRDAVVALHVIRSALTASPSRLPRELIPFLRHLLAFSVCALALLMTGSRAGVFLAIFVFMVVIVMRLPPSRSLKRRLLLVVMFGGIAMLAVAQIIGTVGARIEAVGLDDLGRLDIYHATLQMIRTHVWIGTGLGSFPFVFPTYRLAEASHFGIVDRAHSTPLEMAAELGVPLTAIILACWCLALGLLLRGALARRHHSRVCSAAFVVALFGSLHSLVDFSMQIAGFGIPVLALVGAGLARALSPAPVIERDLTCR